MPAGVDGFLVESETGDDHAVLRLHGELDLDTAREVEAATRDVHRQGIPHLVIDLSGLTFIDSSGLHALVAALRRQREIGGEVVLRGGSSQTRRVLEVTGLDAVFPTA